MLLKPYNTLLFVIFLSIFNILSAEAKQIKLGGLLCLSGSCSEWGNDSKQGSILALEEANLEFRQEGYSFQIDFQDSREDQPVKTLAAYRQLRAEGYQYILGPTWTVGGLPLIPLIKKDPEVIVITPTLGVREFNESSENIFNFWPHDHYATKALANYAIQQDWKRVAILNTQSNWETVQADTFSRYFSEQGGLVVKRIDLLPTQVDLRSEILQIVHSKPDVVFFSNFVSMGIAAKELRKLAYHGSQLAILMDQTRVDDAQGALDECLYASFEDLSKDFAIKYKQRFKEDASKMSATAYDAIKTLTRGIVENENNFSKVGAWMRKLSEQQGASGYLKFDGMGGVIAEPAIFSVREKFNQANN